LELARLDLEESTSRAPVIISIATWPDILPGRGLEPLRIAPPDPKSGASANFATLAVEIYERNPDLNYISIVALSPRIS
jgi:hypothetical protein